MIEILILFERYFLIILIFNIIELSDILLYILDSTISITITIFIIESRKMISIFFDEYMISIEI